jgi:hypothetical protein
VAQSLLRALVGGTRQVLAVQLFIAVAAVALAGWTLAITNEVTRERDRLRERIVQLEGELGARGIVVPPNPTVVARASGDAVYPPEIGLEAGAEPAFNPGRLVSDLFARPSSLRTIVIHARGQTDGIAALRLAEELRRDDGLDVSVNVISARDGRAAGYAYYDGRQARDAATIVAAFNDAARRAELPQWSAQLRGLALPATGEFTAERLDIVLPALPATPSAH